MGKVGVKGCDCVCRYVELVVRLLQRGWHGKWKAELEQKKLTHLLFDTVRKSLCVVVCSALRICARKKTLISG